MNNEFNEDLISERSSNLDIEKLIIKRKNEKFTYLLEILIQFLWAVINVQIKTILIYFPKSFSINNFIFLRMVLVMLIGYLICKIKKINFKENENINWFLLRYFTGYIYILSWIYMFLYFRVSTISVLGSTTAPLIIMFLPLFLINEEFYFRYLIGFLLCIVSSAFIISNDKNPSSKSQILNDNVFCGIMFAICNLIFYSLSAIGQKEITKEGTEINVQNFYFGVFSCIPAFIIQKFINRLFPNEKPLIEFKYLLYVSQNNLIVYICYYMTSFCLKYISIYKFLSISSLEIVFTFILSAIFLGEPIFLVIFFGLELLLVFIIIILCFQLKK